MFEELKERARQLPMDPGVYIMKDERRNVIYVGKAKSLRKRVTSYFTGSRDIKTRILVSRIKSIEHITTHNEYEALLLENNLIKKWKPRYNINLKDGKSYPVIRVTAEDFPRVFRTRRIIQDGSSYYGPFPSVVTLDTYLELIEKLFPLRKCRGDLKKRQNPCLYYHIGRCSAPCVGKITREGYMEKVELVKKLLSGETSELVKLLEKEMGEASGELRFEKAAEYRDAIGAIENIGREQEVVDFDPEVRDYVAFAQKEELGTFIVFQMRAGKLLGRDLFRTVVYTSVEEALSQFVLQYYSTIHTPPNRIYVSHPFDPSLLLEFFRKEKEREVEIEFPADGRHRSIVKMALENGFQDIESRRRALANIPALEELKEVLSLPKLPKRIEGFDIAHLSGKHTVSSMVSFRDGYPDKAKYRYFHIKSLGGAIDDFESMREVVARRYTRVVNDGLERPDFILIDGGKGQVSAAREMLTALGLGDIPLAGLAKKLEEIYLPGKSEPVRLPETSPALKILQAVRDEAHRFATSFNKRLRRKDLSFSLLEKIPGVGPKRSLLLLEQFGSLEALKAASAEDIAEKCKVSLDQADAILSFLKSSPGAGAETEEGAGTDGDGLDASQEEDSEMAAEKE
ncbi:MAG TPA: excinuclease ABC subunit UvrC [Spirochaetia bacterium]|nr:excinuclease ABC subunit UvrC [Spirochaetia bacterium]